MFAEDAKLDLPLYDPSTYERTLEADNERIKAVQGRLGL